MSVTEIESHHFIFLLAPHFCFPNNKFELYVLNSVIILTKVLTINWFYISGVAFSFSSSLQWSEIPCLQPFRFDKQTIHIGMFYNQFIGGTGNEGDPFSKKLAPFLQGPIQTSMNSPAMQVPTTSNSELMPKFSWKRKSYHQIRFYS